MKYKNPKVEFREENNETIMSLEFDEDMIGDRKIHCIIPNIKLDSLLLKASYYDTTITPELHPFKNYQYATLSFKVDKITDNNGYCILNIED